MHTNTFYVSFFRPKESNAAEFVVDVVSTDYTTAERRDASLEQIRSLAAAVVPPPLVVATRADGSTAPSAPPTRYAYDEVLVVFCTMSSPGYVLTNSYTHTRSHSPRQEG